MAEHSRARVEDEFRTGPEWVYSEKKLVAQKINMEYLCFLGGDFYPVVFEL